MNNDLIKRVEAWADSKGLLTDPQPLKQLGKTQEELTELRDEVVLEVAIEDNFQDGGCDDLKMELGDCLVTLLVFAKQMSLSVEECLGMALDKIEKRTGGETVDGVYIKCKQTTK